MYDYTFMIIRTERVSVDFSVLAADTFNIGVYDDLERSGGGPAEGFELCEPPAPEIPRDMNTRVARVQERMQHVLRHDNPL